MPVRSATQFSVADFGSVVSGGGSITAHRGRSRGFGADVLIKRAFLLVLWGKKVSSPCWLRRILFRRHPHFQVLLMTSPGYFKAANTCLNRDLTNFWRHCAIFDYDPVIHVAARDHQQCKAGRHEVRFMISACIEQAA